MPASEQLPLPTSIQKFDAKNTSIRTLLRFAATSVLAVCIGGDGRYPDLPKSSELKQKEVASQMAEVKLIPPKEILHAGKITTGKGEKQYEMYVQNEQILLALDDQTFHIISVSDPQGNNFVLTQQIVQQIQNISITPENEMLRIQKEDQCGFLKVTTGGCIPAEEMNHALGSVKNTLLQAVGINVQDICVYGYSCEYKKGMWQMHLQRVQTPSLVMAMAKQ